MNHFHDILYIFAMYYLVKQFVIQFMPPPDYIYGQIKLMKL